MSEEKQHTRGNGNLWLRAPGEPELCPACFEQELVRETDVGYYTTAALEFPSLKVCPKCRCVSITYEDSAEFRTAAALERIATALEQRK